MIYFALNLNLDSIIFLGATIYKTMKIAKSFHKSRFISFQNEIYLINGTKKSVLLLERT